MGHGSGEAGTGMDGMMDPERARRAGRDERHRLRADVAPDDDRAPRGCDRAGRGGDRRRRVRRRDRPWPRTSGTRRPPRSRRWSPCSTAEPVSQAEACAAATHQRHRTRRSGPRMSAPAGVAQLAERSPCKGNVAGSTPVTGSSSVPSPGVTGTEDMSRVRSSADQEVAALLLQRRLPAGERGRRSPSRSGSRQVWPRASVAARSLRSAATSCPDLTRAATRGRGSPLRRRFATRRASRELTRRRARHMLVRPPPRVSP